jgi:3-deoxy-7-phosphoheptulonate synthase
MTIKDIPAVAEVADIIQVGARNMQNFPLLVELGKAGRPILLKRGFGSTTEELLLSAEYVLANTEDVILCERGIRTFETATRNTFDISAIPVLQSTTHLPVIADPSHAVGRARWVPSMARAAVAAGADGVMLEVHPDPTEARSDGQESLTPEQFHAMIPELASVAAALDRPLALNSPVA